jgi:hypothetical protein
MFTIPTAERHGISGTFGPPDEPLGLYVARDAAVR